MTAAHYPRPSFNVGHTELLLTIKVGPSAGTTHVDCTCGWVRIYKTRQGAIRELNQHRKLNGLSKTDRWSNK